MVNPRGGLALAPGCLWGIAGGGQPGSAAASAGSGVGGGGAALWATRLNRVEDVAPPGHLHIGGTRSLRPWRVVDSWRTPPGARHRAAACSRTLPSSFSTRRGGWFPRSRCTTRTGGSIQRTSPARSIGWSSRWPMSSEPDNSGRSERCPNRLSPALALRGCRRKSLLGGGRGRPLAIAGVRQPTRAGRRAHPGCSPPLSTATEHEHASTEHCYRACVIQYFS